MKLFFSLQDAKRVGMTHEGTLFGVPAWMTNDDECVMAVPKFVPFNAWTLFASFLFDVAADILCNRNTGPLVCPIKVGRSIAQIEGQA